MTGIEAAFRGAQGDFALDVAFEAPMQGVTALFGPSGCGKTSLLRAVAGLSRLPGRLSVGGALWQDSGKGVFLKPHDRSIGYVFQDESLFAHLSVRQNLLFGERRASRGQGSEGQEARALRLDDVVSLLGIGHLLERRPHALSGGERQRVAIGRALLSRPQLLLMDEPLSALDEITKGDILPYLEDLHRNLSIPILYVSHDISEVARLADRMIVLSAGRKITEGSIEEVMERLDLQPITGRFDAGVVLHATVVRHDKEYALSHLEYDGHSLAVPLLEADIGQSIRVRIRARDVSLATQKPEGISVRNIFHGTIIEILEEVGTAYAETLVDVGGAKIRSRVTRASVADLGLKPGSPVYALVKSITF
jgi:molybdate transport system ATP-binding protein